MTLTSLVPTALPAPNDPTRARPGAASAHAASRAGWFTPAALALAGLALGVALQVNFGQYHPAAMPWLTLALLACVAAAVVPNFGRVTVLGWRPDQLVLAVALAVQFALLYSRDPVATLRLETADDLAPFKAGVALAAALVAVGVSGTRAARSAVPLLLLCHLALGVWVIRATPAPGVDVYVFQRDAADALLRGANPYAITFPDVYHGALPVYGAGLARNGRLLFGYPYPPLSLLLALPGHLLGDFRYAHLLSLTLAGGLIAYARPGRGRGETRGNGDAGMSAAIATASAPSRAASSLPLLPLSACPLVSPSPIPGARGVAAAALLLFTPRGFFLVEAGWTEPVPILMLAATVFAACRWGRRWSVAGAVALGLFLASKQYLVLALPLVLLLPTPRLPGRRMAAVAVAIAAAAVVSLPLALWDVGAFVHSAVTLQFRQPFRADALSYLVPLHAARGVAAPAWAAFACAGAATLLALWRCPRTPAGFAGGLALVLFGFFATNKQAFCNYYALVLAALCCALAATPGLPGAVPRKP